MLKKIQNYLKRLKNKEATLSDIWYYVQGHTREKIYYSKFRFLIRKHIREQFEWRLKLMEGSNKTCFINGQCDICGCDIPALTLANKDCHGECYPPMMSNYEWKIYKKYFICGIK